MVPNSCAVPRSLSHFVGLFIGPSLPPCQAPPPPQNRLDPEIRENRDPTVRGSSAFLRIYL
jgi:hypothetical protein